MPAIRRKPHKARPFRSPRTSVTFPLDLYETLESLAKKKKVSVAWVVREAAERYVADQWPLFAKSQS
jgi:predicted DNA-binding protein